MTFVPHCSWPFCVIYEHSEWNRLQCRPLKFPSVTPLSELTISSAPFSQVSVPGLSPFPWLLRFPRSLWGGNWITFTNRLLISRAYRDWKGRISRHHAIFFQVDHIYRGFFHASPRILETLWPSPLPRRLLYGNFPVSATSDCGYQELSYCLCSLSSLSIVFSPRASDSPTDFCQIF